MGGEGDGMCPSAEETGDTRVQDVEENMKIKFDNFTLENTSNYYSTKHEGREESFGWR